MTQTHDDESTTPTPTTVHDRVAEQLAQAQQRYTSGRRRLVTLLVGAGRPLSLPELLDRDPELPQSSAYRNLDLLESTGLVRRIATETDHARYELAESLLGHHHHLICTSCGSIQDVRLPPDVEDAVEHALTRCRGRGTVPARVAHAGPPRQLRRMPTALGCRRRRGRPAVRFTARSAPGSAISVIPAPYPRSGPRRAARERPPHRGGSACPDRMHDGSRP